MNRKCERDYNYGANFLIRNQGQYQYSDEQTISKLNSNELVYWHQIHTRVSPGKVFSMVFHYFLICSNSNDCFRA